MDTIPLDKVLEKLNGVKARGGKGHRALCPAHDDHNPSLDIDVAADGKVLLICRAGCKGSDVVRAAGLTMADLFPREHVPRIHFDLKAYPNITTAFDSHNLGRPAGMWAYQNAHGDTVGAVARWDTPNGKTFRQCVNTDRGYVNKAMPAPAPLYQLPDILDADTVVVCEGEKAADAARSIGLDATTWAGGSKATDKPDLTPLAGKTVPIVADNDDPGQDCARIMATKLLKLSPPAIVKIVNLPGLPPKGDIVEWIEAHGDAATPEVMKAEFLDIASRVPAFTGLNDDGLPFDDVPPTDEPKQEKKKDPLGTWKPKPLTSADFARGDYRHEWVVQGMLVAREVAGVYGPSKGMKTTFLVLLAICIAYGQSVFGVFKVPRRRRVLIISCESGENSLQSLALRICDSLGIRLEDIGDWLIWEFSVPPIATMGTLEQLQALITLYGAEVIIIDPAYLTLMAGGGDADSASNAFAMGPLLAALAAACREGGAMLIIGHHTNTTLKIGEEPTIEHIMYAGFKQFFRQWIGLNRRAEYKHDGLHEMRFVFGGSAGHQGDYFLDIDTGILNEDYTGLKFETAIIKRGDAVAASKSNTEAQKNDAIRIKLQTKIAQFLENMDAIISSGHPAATRNRLSEGYGWNTHNINAVTESLIIDGVIEEHTFQYAAGKNAKKTATGFRRPVVVEQTTMDFANDQPDQPDSRVDIDASRVDDPVHEKEHPDQPDDSPPLRGGVTGSRVDPEPRGIRVKKTNRGKRNTARSNKPKLKP